MLDTHLEFSYQITNFLCWNHAIYYGMFGMIIQKIAIKWLKQNILINFMVYSLLLTILVAPLIEINWTNSEYIIDIFRHFEFKQNKAVELFKQNKTWNKQTIPKSKSTDRLTTQQINLAQNIARSWISFNRIDLFWLLGRPFISRCIQKRCIFPINISINKYFCTLYDKFSCIDNMPFWSFGIKSSIQNWNRSIEFVILWISYPLLPS